MVGIHLARGTTAWEFLDLPEPCRPTELLGEWERLVAETDNIKRIYQSPQWLAHLRATAGGTRLVLAAARDPGGRLLGLAPLSLGPTSLAFEVSGRRLARPRFHQLSLLGGQPLLPPVPALYDSLLVALHGAFPGCGALGLGRVPRGGFLWCCLRQSPVVLELFLAHRPDGPGLYHTLPLGPTLDDYLARFNAKKRYNLNRQVRVLREHARGRLELVRVDSRAQVGALLDACVRLARHAGGARGYHGRDLASPGGEHPFADLAGRGLLRCYLLLCDATPVAAMLGYQYRDVYSVCCTPYHRDFARFSPGAVLLHLAVADLLGHRPVGLIDFGFGEPHYNYSSTHASWEGASVLLFRRGLANRARVAAHGGFQWVVRSLKRGLVLLGLKRGRASPLPLSPRLKAFPCSPGAASTLRAGPAIPFAP